MAAWSVPEKPFVGDEQRETEDAEADSRGEADSDSEKGAGVAVMKGVVL
jgi:hypothetical protein